LSAALHDMSYQRHTREEETRPPGGRGGERGRRVKRDLDTHGKVNTDGGGRRCRNSEFSYRRMHITGISSVIL
jgi:hypothetical protein